MTESEQIDLQGAVSELNLTLEKLIEKYGDSIQVRPGVGFNVEEHRAYVYVEVTTGVEKFQ